jgi:hypothetical protein
MASKSDDLDPVGAEPDQRLLERTHGAIIGIVEPGGMRQAAGEIRRLGIAIGGLVKRIHPTADLGRKRIAVARRRAQGGADTVLRQSVAVEGRRVVERHTRFKRRLHRAQRGLLVEAMKEIAKRRGAEAKRGDRDARPPEDTRFESHGALFPVVDQCG